METYLGLRNMVLTQSRADFGIPQPQSLTEPWGVLMEFRLDKVSVSVVALIDGTCSIYLSTGGGYIGGQESEPVRRAAIAMVREASKLLSGLTPASSYPLPEQGQTGFYFRTESGVLSAAAPEERLREATHPLSGLFHAGQEVITQFRLLDEEDKL